MRVALISDLHGNEVALDAVLADIQRRGADRVVCLGDTATLGPHPEAVLDRLRDLGCTCILGNHDAFMLDAELVRSYSEAPIIIEAVDWCRARLSTEHLAFVKTFVATSEIELTPDAKLFLFHGTPRSHMEDLLCTTPPDKVDEMLGGHRASVMACGHTHIQMVRQHKSMLIVNPGSLGMPFEQYVQGKAPKILPHAEYAIVEADGADIDVRLRRVALDKKALRTAAQANDNPLGAELAKQYA